MTVHRVDVELELPGTRRFRVVSCRVREAVSRPVHAHVVIACEQELELPEGLRGDVRLVLTHGDTERAFTLRLGRARLDGITDGQLRYTLDLRSSLWLQGLTRSVRKFQNQTTAQIVGAVLGEAGVAHTFELAEAARVRPYTVQYRESNLAFVSRLCEDDGIHYAFGDDGAVVFRDRSATAQQVDGSFALIDAAGALERGDLGVHALQRGARVAPGMVTVNDQDWKNPALSLLQSTAADRDADLEVYDWPAGYRLPADGVRIAERRLEEQRVRARFIAGQGNVISFAAGRIFRFDVGHGRGASFEGEYFLIGVEHEVELPRDKGEARYANTFDGIPRAVPFRPARTTPRPTVAGSHTAMVRGPAGEEIHTDPHGRFKAQFHWDREATGTDADSRWVRMLQESASSMMLARVGWEVGVAYVDGDPDRPIGISRQINGAMLPTFEQPAQKNKMAVRTPSSPATGGYNELTMDDSATTMKMAVRAEKDMVSIIQNDQTETVARDCTHLARANVVRSIERDQTITVGADARMEISGSDALSVTVDRTKKVGSDEKVDVKGTVSESITGNDSERVGGRRMTITGSVAMPDMGGMAKGAVAGLKGAPVAAGRAGMAAALGGGGVGGAVGASLQGAPAGALGAATGGLSSGVSAGKVMGLLCNGSITRTAQSSMKRLVGGASAITGFGDIVWNAQYAYAELVGGAKVAIAGKGMGTSVGGPMAIAVGGLVIRAAKGELQLSSLKASVTAGGLASIDAATTLSIKAPAVSITAVTGIEMSASDAKIELGPGSAKLTGDVQLRAGSKIVVTGGKERLT